MAKGSHSSCALALVLSQALWVLPGVQPASAQQVTLPANFISPRRPARRPGRAVCHRCRRIQELAIFAWQEFIALNWVAQDPGTSGKRGRPAPFTDPNTGFLDIAPDANGSFPLVVWQTYRHKNELFPADGTTDPSFDSSMPTYKYATNPTTGTGVNGQIPSFNLFNNLDETSQIGLANMYAHATADAARISDPATGIRVAYEAKVNRALFEYLVDNGLTNADERWVTPLAIRDQYMVLKISRIRRNMQPPHRRQPQPIVMLPCGDVGTAGDAGEGAIEIKAAWRALTPAEVSHGRFFTRNVIFYTGPQPATGQASITMQCGGWLPCTSSTRPNRSRPSSSRPGSRSTITMTMLPAEPKPSEPGVPEYRRCHNIFPISP